MNSQQFEINLCAIQCQVELLKIEQEIEAAGKEYDAPWLKKAKSIFRAPSGRFAARASLTEKGELVLQFGNEELLEEGKELLDKGEELLAEGGEFLQEAFLGMEEIDEDLARFFEESFRQMEEFQEKVENLSKEERARIDTYTIAPFFGEVLRKTSDTLETGNKHIDKGFKAVATGLEKEREKGIKGLLHSAMKMVAGAAKKAVEVAPEVGKGLVVGAVLAAGVFISPLIPVFLGSVSIAKRLGSWGTVSGKNAKLKVARKILEDASAIDTTGDYLKGVAEQVVFDAAVATAVISGALLAGEYLISQLSGD